MQAASESAQIEHRRRVSSRKKADKKKRKNGTPNESERVRLKQERNHCAIGCARSPMAHARGSFFYNIFTNLFAAFSSKFNLVPLLYSYVYPFQYRRNSSFGWHLDDAANGGKKFEPAKSPQRGSSPVFGWRVPRQPTTIGADARDRVSRRWIAPARVGAIAGRRLVRVVTRGREPGREPARSHEARVQETNATATATATCSMAAAIANAVSTASTGVSRSRSS